MHKFLKGKTRILFTPNMENLEKVDYIYYIENGKIVGEGLYQ